MKLCTNLLLVLATGAVLPHAAHGADMLSVDVATHRLTTALHPSLVRTGQNMVWSPVNLRDLLCMAAHGARGGTRQEFDGLLGFRPGAEWAQEMSLSRTQLHSRLTRSVQIYASGRGWVVGGEPIFRPEYERELREVFLASILRPRSIEEVPAVVDGWVSEKTRGHIASMGFKPPAGATSYACLLAAIYMQGNWQHAFPADRTTMKRFTNESGSVSSVMTMAQEEEFSYAEDGMVQALTLPFGAGDVAMTILLPRGSNKLADVEAQIGGSKISSRLAARENCRVNMTLPRFRITSDFNDMKCVLVGAGLKSLSEEPTQDFSGISALSPGQQFFVGQIVHKAGIEVDETGAKAWAASGTEFIGMGSIERQPPRREFRADHPFLFLIHTEGPFIPLFIGRVANL